MAIVSISLDDKTLKELDLIEKQDKFAGRSELIRAAVNTYISSRKELDNLEGNVNCIITVKYSDNNSDKISDIKHEFQDIIKTEIHNHMKNHKCLETFVIDGNSKEVKEFYKLLEVSRKLEYIKLIVP